MQPLRPHRRGCALMAAVKWYSIQPARRKKIRKSWPTHNIQQGRFGMPVAIGRVAIASAAFVLLAASSNGALAQKKYDTGATDTEIKIGNIMPYSGPASAYGVIGKTEQAYFNKINAAAASTAARSTSSAMTTAIARRRRSSRRASWSRATRCCSSSIRWERPRTRQSTST